MSVLKGLHEIGKKAPSKNDIAEPCLLRESRHAGAAWIFTNVLELNHIPGLMQLS
jgi:hypothetical protein